MSAALYAQFAWLARAPDGFAAACKVLTDEPAPGQACAYWPHTGWTPIN